MYGPFLLAALPIGAYEPRYDILDILISLDYFPLLSQRARTPVYLRNECLFFAAFMGK